jgi:anti-sigma regulatory factor (Ser/Thr protein kinase)
VMAELVLNQGPDAVPKARRLVASVLKGCPSSVVADAELIVAELATNALLHGAPPVRLRLKADNDRIRIELEDTGRTVPVRIRHSTQAMTGRGLDLVAAIAADWGVAPSDDGKTVWAEVVEAERSDDLMTSTGEASADDIDALLAAWKDDEIAAGGFTVQLGSVPTELLLQAKAHIDNIVREMTLVSHTDAAGDIALAPEMKALISSVTEDFADARAEIKRQALGAAQRGEPFTDLRLTMPLSAAAAGERYLAALDQADRFARSARLLTLAPPRSHRVFREWYVRAIIDQLRAAGRGEVAPRPTPFAQVLTAEVDRLPALEESQLRLDLLQRLSGELVRTTDAQQVADVVVNAVAAYPGVETVRMYELVDEQMLRSVAWYGRNPAAAIYDEIRLDADLPGAAVARTGEPIFLRSLAQIYDRFPDLAGYYSLERSLHIMPLRSHDATLGLLALTFQGGEIPDESQVAFVRSIVDVTVRALDRAYDLRGSG